MASETFQILAKYVRQKRTDMELCGLKFQSISSWERNTLLLATLLVDNQGRPVLSNTTGLHIDWTQALNLLLTMSEVQF